MMWLILAYLVIALRFDLRLWDAVLPFFLIVLVSVAIASIGEGNGLLFFYIMAAGQITGLVNFPRMMRLAARYPENEPVLSHSDYRLVYALGGVSAALPLATAIMLQSDWVGTRGAAVSMGLLDVVFVALALSFSRAWWNAIDAATREETVA
jgi:hypothetical protein